MSENQQSNNESPTQETVKKNPLMTVATWVVTIAVFMGVKFLFSYGRGEVEVVASKFTTWDSSFRKSFVKECMVSARSSFESKTDPSRLNEPNVQLFITNYTEMYCNCAQKAVEENHVIATKYNKLNRSLAEAEKDSMKAITDYMKSPEGSKQIQSCDETAFDKTKSILEA